MAQSDNKEPLNIETKDIDSKDNGSLSLKERQHLLTILDRPSIGTVLVSLACASVLTFGFLDNGNATDRLTWFSVFCLAVVLRLTSIVFWRKHTNSSFYHVDRHTFHIILGIVCIASLWGLYAIFVVPKITNSVELAATITIFTGLAGGAASTLSGNKKVALAYVLILMTPISSVLVFANSSLSFLLGCLAFGFTIVIAISAYRSADFTLMSVKIRYQNAKLVEELAVKNQAISEANSLLETRVKERTAELHRLSNIDPLTNLSNRFAFSSNLKTLMETSDKSGDQFALFFIDLDGFKTINDAHGHEIGDFVLGAVAQRLLSLRQSDGLLCRWGGDEFLATTHENEKKQIDILANSLISVLSHPINTKAGSVSVSATIGVSIYPVHGVSESELIAHADIAMYQQKKDAKGNVRLFSADMQEAITRQAYIKDGLSCAISNNEFYLVFQPVVDSLTNQVLFAEALIRWQKNDETIPPDEFISIAEQFGFIKNLGFWVAEQVAKELSTYKNAEMLCVSINISIAQLMQDNIASSFSSLFSTYDIAPSQIYIEVTETLLTTNTETLINNLNQLKTNGFNIAIDDFGTGYSSLSQLQQISPKILKIDKSFVDNWDAGGEAIIEAIGTISGKLDFDIVLEGIEDQAQVPKAKKLGVHLLQGFYFAKPMSMAKLQSWRKAKTKSTT